MPEAKLAREAELCYATIAMVTDYDSWSDDKKHVTTEDVMRVMGSNVHKAKNLIVSLTQALSKKRHVCSGGCDRALQNAIMTPPSSRDPVLLQKLDAIAKRVLHE
jgi:5'-methylthioadenosine phosphorylase